MKNKYYFTVGAPITEERNFIMFYRESSLTKDSISHGLLVSGSGENYPLFPINNLKDYLLKNKWTVLYRDTIKMEGDDELTEFICSENIPVIETDEDLNKFLDEYYKFHPKEC